MEAQQVMGTATARRIVASFPRYIEAQRAFSFLEGQKFPMERVRIVADDPRPATATVRHTSWLQAAVDGAVSGAVTGLLLGLFLDLAGWMTPLISGFLLGIGGLVFGLIVGALVGLLVRAVSGGHSLPASTTALEAGQYSLMVDAEEADMAARLIHRVW
jgi:hypothetical protein